MMTYRVIIVSYLDIIMRLKSINDEKMYGIAY